MARTPTSRPPVDPARAARIDSELAAQRESARRAMQLEAEEEAARDMELANLEALSSAQLGELNGLAETNPALVGFFSAGGAGGAGPTGDSEEADDLEPDDDADGLSYLGSDESETLAPAQTTQTAVAATHRTPQGSPHQAAADSGTAGVPRPVPAAPSPNPSRATLPQSLRSLAAAINDPARAAGLATVNVARDLVLIEGQERPGMPARGGAEPFEVAAAEDLFDLACELITTPWIRLSFFKPGKELPHLVIPFRRPAAVAAVAPQAAASAPTGIIADLMQILRDERAAADNRLAQALEAFRNDPVRRLGETLQTAVQSHVVKAIGHNIEKQITGVGAAPSAAAPASDLASQIAALKKQHDTLKTVFGEAESDDFNPLTLIGMMMGGGAAQPAPFSVLQGGVPSAAPSSPDAELNNAINSFPEAPPAGRVA